MTVELWTLSLGETALICLDRSIGSVYWYHANDKKNHVRITVVGVKLPFGRDNRVIAFSRMEDTPTHASQATKLVPNIDISKPKAIYGLDSEWKFTDIRPYHALLYVKYNWLVGREYLSAPYIRASEIQAGDTICTVIDNRLLRVEVSSVSEFEDESDVAKVSLSGIIQRDGVFEDTSKPLKLKSCAVVCVINRQYPVLYVDGAKKKPKPSRLFRRKLERNQ